MKPSLIIRLQRFLTRKVSYLIMVAVLICTVPLGACSITPGVENGTSSDMQIKKIDAYLQAGISEGYSGAVLIAKDGDILLNRGYGLSNKAEDTQFTSDTVFTIGSVTKQFTATAVLLLIDQSDMTVNDPISRFFPNLPNDKKDITVHQLLTHSSGLQPSIGDGDFDHIPTEEFFERLFKSKLLFKPGEKYMYSNAGYSVLARIIELQSGKDYEVFLAAQIFDPVGMRQTGYLQPEWERANIAHGYMRNITDRGTLIERFREDGGISWNLKGNGGIHSTMNDMYLWYSALENNLVLSPEQTQTLTTPYVAESESETSHYAYGWAIFASSRKTKINTHNGGNGVFFFDFLWLPEEDAVILFATNASSRQVELAWRIEKMLFDEFYEPKPIIKNVYNYVSDYIGTSPSADIEDLETTLRRQYSDEISRPETLNRLGYLFLNSNEKLDWVIELFSLNTRLFPNDGNVWDSLGEAYQIDGQVTNAIESYREALRLGEDASAIKLDKLLIQQPDVKQGR